MNQTADDRTLSLELQVKVHQFIFMRCVVNISLYWYEVLWQTVHIECSFKLVHYICFRFRLFVKL